MFLAPEQRDEEDTFSWVPMAHAWTLRPLAPVSFLRPYMHLIDSESMDVRLAQVGKSCRFFCERSGHFDCTLRSIKYQDQVSASDGRQIPRICGTCWLSITFLGTGSFQIKWGCIGDQRWSRFQITACMWAEVFLICIILNLFLAWCVTELVWTCCLHLWMVLYHIFAFHANSVSLWIARFGQTRNDTAMSHFFCMHSAQFCSLPSPHPYLAHGTHNMVWSLYVPKALFFQVRPFRIHYSCIYVGVLWCSTYWRSSMDAGIKWPHFAHEKATGSESFVAMYVQVNQLIHVSKLMLFKRTNFWDVFDDFKGAWPWYVHKAGFAIGALVYFFCGEGKLFNKK